MNYTRIEKYINVIDPIDKGHRNKGMHNVGLCFRGNFGLTGDALEAALSEVNRTKCNPPLPDSDITTIARSVDRSNVPIGEANATYNKQHVAKKSKPVQTTYGVRVIANAVPVDTFLSKEISLYSHCRATKPNRQTTIGEALKTFRTGGKSKGLIEAVRSEPDKEKRDELKKSIPAVVFGSEPQAERKNAACKQNGTICLDFDGIPVDKMTSAKEQIAAVPYVFAVGLSVSGNGLFALAAYEGTPNLKTLLPAMQPDFHYTIDPSRSDVCGLRFVTLDEALIEKESVAPAILTETAVESVPSEMDESEPLRYVPFPVDCLPETMRIITRGVQRTIGLKDASSTAIACLSATATVIGASCKIRIKRNYEQPAHIFTGIVAKSSMGKSPATDLLLDIHERKESEWIEKWKSDIDDYDRELVLWKSQKKETRGEPPTEPAPAKRLIVKDITIEGLGQRLSENPLGLLLYPDELDGLLGNMGRYNNGRDLPHYIAIYNGKPLKIDRADRNKRLTHVPTPSLTITGGIQNAILRERVKENPDYFHSGFIARFFLAMPPGETPRDNDNELSHYTEQRYEKFIDSLLLARDSRLVDGKIYPMVFALTDEARGILREHQHRHADAADDATGAESTVEGKFMTNAARIALILHVAGLVDAKIPLTDLPPVSADTMRNACTVTEWFTNEAKRIYAMLRGEQVDGELTADQRVVMKVLREYGPATIRDLKYQNRTIRKMENPDGVLSELLELDKVERHSETGKGNRGTTWWKVKISTVSSVVVVTNSAEHGKYGINDNDNSGNTNENDFSDPGVVEGFGEYQNQEATPESPVPLCPKCVHHRPATYPNGLCEKEYCQQDLPCHDFKEIAKTESIDDGRVVERCT